MKKLIISVVVASVFALMLTSCASVAPGYGLLGTGAVVPGVSMEKKGEATADFLLGFIPLKGADCSVSKAAENGGITKIATIDSKKVNSIFVIKKTTIVTGE